MKKIEAKTLEDAYAVATKEFGCSITELDCEIVQYPSSGFMGLFSKSAIIVVARKHIADAHTPGEETIQIKEVKTDTPKQHIEPKVEPKKVEEPAEETISLESTVSKTPEYSEDSIVSEFFEDKKDDRSASPASRNNVPLQEEIEKQLTSLIGSICFDIDTVEVDVIDDTAYVFIDGEDAALLIGKEGYRYNALSYLVSNWLQNRYNLYLKLEIAQFLASQQEMIRSYMEPVIEHVEEHGWGRTRALDGVLVQIALEQLREEFPNKYVAIKRTRNGDRYVLINEFNKK